MTEQRKGELADEIDCIRNAGTDPANCARKRLLEICDELLGIDRTAQSYEEWKQSQRESACILNMRKVRRA